MSTGWAGFMRIGNLRGIDEMAAERQMKPYVTAFRIGEFILL